MENSPPFFDPFKRLENLINRLIPSLKGSFLLVGYQHVLMILTLISIVMWASEGYDTTIHWWAYNHNFAQPAEDMYGLEYGPGIGIHWSTLTTIALGALNLSFYLKKRLDVDGLINILYSLLIGWWVSMMIFEIPYVFLQEVFHNNGYEAVKWPIWLAGKDVIYLGAGGTAGSDAVRWFVIAALLFPIEGCTAYAILVRKYLSRMMTNIGVRGTKVFLVVSTVIVYGLLTFVTVQMLLVYGILPVVIRNIGWFGGVILAYGLMVYEFNRPTRSGNPMHVTFRFFDRTALTIFSGVIVGWLFWVYYPRFGEAMGWLFGIANPLPFIQAKGDLFPQTVYAWYGMGLRVIVRQAWIPNDIVHTVNIALKAVIALWTCYVFAPKVSEAAPSEHRAPEVSGGPISPERISLVFPAKVLLITDDRLFMTLYDTYDTIDTYRGRRYMHHIYVSYVSIVSYRVIKSVSSLINKTIAGAQTVIGFRMVFT